MKLVAGSYERFLWGWHVRTKQAELHLAFSYPAHLGPVKSIAASGTLVATGGADDTIKVFDVNAQKDIGSLYVHTGAVTCLDLFKPEVSPLDRPTHLLSGSEDGTIGIWDTDSWAHLKSLKGHKSALNSLTVHQSGRVVLSVERNGHLKMWNLLNGRCTFTSKLASEGTLIKFFPQTGESYAVVRAEKLEIHNAESGFLIHSLEHDKRIFCLAQNQDELIVSGGEDRIIRGWDTRSGKLAFSVPDAHSNRIRGVSIPDSSESSELPHLIASASSDGSVRVWDVRMIPSSKDQTSPVPVFATSTKARLTCLVSCGSAKRLKTPALANSEDGDALTETTANGNGNGNHAPVVTTKVSSEVTGPQVGDSSKKKESAHNAGYTAATKGVATKAARKGGKKNVKDVLKQSEIVKMQGPSSQRRKKRKKHQA